MQRTQKCRAESSDADDAEQAYNNYITYCRKKQVVFQHFLQEKYKKSTAHDLNAPDPVKPEKPDGSIVDKLARNGDRDSGRAGNSRRTADPPDGKPDRNELKKKKKRLANRHRAL